MNTTHYLSHMYYEYEGHEEDTELTGLKPYDFEAYNYEGSSEFWYFQNTMSTTDVEE